MLVSYLDSVWMFAAYTTVAQTSKRMTSAGTHCSLKPQPNINIGQT